MFKNNWIKEILCHGLHCIDFFGLLKTQIVTLADFFVPFLASKTSSRWWSPRKKRYPWNSTFLHRRSLFMLTSFQSLFIDHCIKLCWSNRKLFTFFRQLPTQSIPVACPERIEVRIQSLESKSSKFSVACSRPVHLSVVMKTTKLGTGEGERLLP